MRGKPGVDFMSMTRPAAIVTTGPASAPIDEVRRITNFASGETGVLLAETLLAHGWEVFLFCGRARTHAGLPDGAHLREFDANEDLAHGIENLSQKRSGEILAVFHAAALSDYTVASVQRADGMPIPGHKIPGNLPEVKLTLVPAPKVLPRLRGWFSRAWIVGWKYELDGSRDEAVATARSQIMQNHTDATVINGTAYGTGFGVLDGPKKPLHLATKRELADFLASRATESAKAHE